MNDRTVTIEEAVSAESKPQFKHLVGLWLYVFQSTKIVSTIYLVLVILLAILRPLLAMIWASYIAAAQNITPESELASTTVLILAYFIIHFISDIITSYTEQHEDIERLDLVHANRVQELMLSRMFRKLSRLYPEFFEVAKINDNIEQVFSNIGSRFNGVGSNVMRRSFLVIGKVASVISVAASLYVFNPWLTLMVLLAPIPAISSAIVSQRESFLFAKGTTQLRRKMKYFQDLMLSSAAKELLTLGLHDFIYGKWKALADEYTYEEQKLALQQMKLQTIGNVISGTANAGSRVFAIALMSLGQISLGALGAAMTLSASLSNDVSLLINNLSQFLAKKNEAAQFNDLMSLPEQGKNGASVKTLEETLETFSQLEASNLKYRYPLTERYVLDEVNLTIRQGEKIALVGENGAGKTTFVKLITGQLIPSDGNLSINGVPIETLPAATLYDMMSVVSQNPARYETFSVADNVFLGDVSQTRDETILDEALAFSEFKGADKTALLGKTIGGTDLSGGQWQKLAIARAAYRGKGLIILDEPTSNLDPIAEAEIFRKYIELAQDKTVIFVTHRISVASLADRIIVFSGGRVVQDGSRESLAKSEGEYARLYATQARWYDR